MLRRVLSGPRAPQEDLAGLLGLELPADSYEPELSRKLAECWRRWHITLSTGLRDDLYLSAAGNRSAAFAVAGAGGELGSFRL